MGRTGPYIIKDFIKPHLNNGSFGSKLIWEDEIDQIFKIKWSHKSDHSWSKDEVSVFEAWDRLKGREVKSIEYDCTAKQRFISALRKKISQNQLVELNRVSKEYRRFKILSDEPVVFEPQLKIPHCEITSSSEILKIAPNISSIQTKVIDTTTKIVAATSNVEIPQKEIAIIRSENNPRHRLLPIPTNFTVAAATNSKFQQREIKIARNDIRPTHRLIPLNVLIHKDQQLKLQEQLQNSQIAIAPMFIVEKIGLSVDSVPELKIQQLLPIIEKKNHPYVIENVVANVTKEIEVNSNVNIDDDINDMTIDTIEEEIMSSISQIEEQQDLTKSQCNVHANIIEEMALEIKRECDVNIVTENECSLLDNSNTSINPPEPFEESILGNNDSVTFSSKEGHIATLFPLKNHVPINFGFRIHISCSKSCLGNNNVCKYKNVNNLALPMYMGFERLVYKRNTLGAQLVVVYRAPCGKSLRCFQDVYAYLMQTGSSLNINYFSFNHEVFPFRLFKVSEKECLWVKNDIAASKEKYPISCVNWLTEEKPSPLKYITKSVPGSSILQKQDKKFLCGCDCIDNCLDSSRCQCQQLTNEFYSKRKLKVGYQFKRLKECVITGIYECNSSCSCNKDKCLNRVVQNGLEVRLQLFKTENKGWGVRCIDDLDAGTFLCQYIGEIHSDQMADYCGKLQGDEYFAELDHIEVAGKFKEGYEANAPLIDNEDNAQLCKTSDNQNFNTTNLHSFNDYDDDAFDEDDDISSSSSLCFSSNESESDDSYMEFETNNATSSTNTNLPSSESEDSEVASQSIFNVRQYFNESNCYVMDAMKKGNISRYFNHSCNPNVFVQNVFTKTHDLRFPSVAFFTSCHVKAGTELVWDYNYKINSIENKTLVCHCGSKNCRGRLL